MLYITTRSNDENYTAHTALTADLAKDGGYFVPFRLPTYSPEEIDGFKEKSFCQTLAEILNMFFSARLDANELELRMGRNIPRVLAINHKILMAELWKNPKGNYTYLENVLHLALVGMEAADKPKEWERIAIGIATFFGLYGQVLRQDLLPAGQSFDICVNSDEFMWPIVSWYCRKMGLPINVITCANVDDSTLWDFLHRGTISTTLISDTLQHGMERLLQGIFGCTEAEKFHLACAERQPYSLTEEMLNTLNEGLFCSVSGEDRVKQTINSVFRSNSYIMTPQSALSYSGLQDYRAKTGNSEPTMILAMHTPKDCVTEICEYTGLRSDRINEYID